MYCIIKGYTLLKDDYGIGTEEIENLVVRIQEGILKSPWAGFKNFEYLFKTSYAWVITRNTIHYNLVFIILCTVLAILVAILLNEIASKFASGFYQIVILIPYLLYQC